MIKKEGSEYEVKSESDARSFGKYKSKAAADKRLGQVEYFKHEGKTRNDKHESDLHKHLAERERARGK